MFTVDWVHFWKGRCFAVSSPLELGASDREVEEGGLLLRGCNHPVVSDQSQGAGGPRGHVPNPTPPRLLGSDFILSPPTNINNGPASLAQRRGRSGRWPAVAVQPEGTGRESRGCKGKYQHGGAARGSPGRRAARAPLAANTLMQLAAPHTLRNIGRVRVTSLMIEMLNFLASVAR